MDSERQSSEACTNVIQPTQLKMMNQDDIENLLNLSLILHEECKTDGSLDNDNLNLDLDNHNSRFETLYSQPIEAQDSKKICNNGNISREICFKQQEACCSSSGSSNTSSSSEDSPINPPLRRSSKTLSFGKRKGKKYNFRIFLCLCVYLTYMINAKN